MSSLEESPPKESKSTIMVVCTDNKIKIKVDLNLFPSEMLRKLAKSEFADNKEVEIIYDSFQFLKLYNKYLPQIEDYFGLPHVENDDSILILDVAVYVYANTNLSFGRFKTGIRFVCMYKKNEYICEEDAQEWDINNASFDSNKTWPFLVNFYPFGKFKNVENCWIGSIKLPDKQKLAEFDKENLALFLEKEFIRLLTFEPDGKICQNQSFIRWFKYNYREYRAYR